MNNPQPFWSRMADAIVHRLGGYSESQINDIRNRAFESGLEAGEIDDEPTIYDSSGNPIGKGYRVVGQAKRDLSNISQENAIQASYRLWQTNPLAQALTEIRVDHVIGEGVQIKYQNDEVKEVIEAFVEDDVNNLQEAGFREITRELGLYGEQVLLMFPRYGDEKIKGDGRVRYGVIDPSLIESLITHPQNFRDVYAIKLKDEAGKEGPVYMVIRDDVGVGEKDAKEGAMNLARYREALSDDTEIDLVNFKRKVPTRVAEWRVSGTGDNQGLMRSGILQRQEAQNSKVADRVYDGQCIFAQVNKLSTGTRGRPDLLPMLDWLDQLDNVFFDGVEHINLLNLFAWDLMVKGGSTTDPNPDLNLDIQAKRVGKLNSQSVYSHNEGVELNPKSPTLNSSDIDQIVRTLRIFISGGARTPEHWVAEGGYTNRATAQEMGKPTYRMLVARQGVMKSLFERMIRYAIDVAVALGHLEETVEVELPDGTKEKILARDAFEVVMPEIDTTDTETIAGAFAQVMSALILGITSKILPRRTAMEVLTRFLGMFGIDTDVDTLEQELEDANGPLSELGTSEELLALAQQLAKQIKGKEKDEGESEGDEPEGEE